MEHRMIKRMTAIAFLTVVFMMAGLYLRRASSVWSAVINGETGIRYGLDSFYTAQIPGRWKLIELYGAVQKLLGRKTIEDFTLVKTTYGKIEQLQKRQTEEELEEFADNIQIIRDYTVDKGIPMFYLTSLLPVVDAADLPAGITEYSHENASALLVKLRARDIPIIDLRQSEAIGGIAKEELFYRTDHHWSAKTCFLAYAHTISEINKRMGWNLDPEKVYTSLENYKVFTKEDSFLGSYGIKVGRYYAGQDDFTAYIPQFATWLDFKRYGGDHSLLEEREGGYVEAFLDMDLVEDETYFNKYNAFLRDSYIESRVMNRLADNELKVLLISHSYGRPFTPCLSLCFRETRYLDPQKGRYNDNYLEYIDAYSPDLVLVMTEFEGMGIGIEVGDRE